MNSTLKNICADSSRTFFVGLSFYENISGIKKDLRSMECRFSNMVEKMLDMLRVHEKTGVKCVVVSVEELGFESETPYREVCAKAISLGLQYCPPTLGPQYRLWYKNQPEGECLFVGMESLFASSDCPGIFSVLNIKNTLWLGWQNGSDSYRCKPEFRFIFQVSCESLSPHEKT